MARDDKVVTIPVSPDMKNLNSAIQDGLDSKIFKINKFATTKKALEPVKETIDKSINDKPIKIQFVANKSSITSFKADLKKQLKAIDVDANIKITINDKSVKAIANQVKKAVQQGIQQATGAAVKSATPKVKAPAAPKTSTPAGPKTINKGPSTNIAYNTYQGNVHKGTVKSGPTYNTPTYNTTKNVAGSTSYTTKNVASAIHNSSKTAFNEYFSEQSAGSKSPMKNLMMMLKGGTRFFGGQGKFQSWSLNAQGQIFRNSPTYESMFSRFKRGYDEYKGLTREQKSKVKSGKASTKTGVGEAIMGIQGIGKAGLVGLASALVGAIISVITSAFNIWKGIFVKSFKSLFMPAISIFKGFAGILSKAASSSQMISAILELTVLPFLLMFEFIFMPVIKALIPVVKGLISWIVENKDAIEEWGNALADFLKEFLQPILKGLDKLVGDPIGGVIEIMADMLTSVLDYIQRDEIKTKIAKSLESVISSGLKLMASSAQLVAEIVTQLSDALYNALKSDELQTAWGIIKESLIIVLNKITEFISSDSVRGIIMDMMIILIQTFWDAFWATIYGNGAEVKSNNVTETYRRESGDTSKRGAVEAILKGLADYRGVAMTSEDAKGAVSKLNDAEVAKLFGQVGVLYEQGKQSLVLSSWDTIGERMSRAGIDLSSPTSSQSNINNSTNYTINGMTIGNTTGNVGFTEALDAYGGAYT